MMKAIEKIKDAANESGMTVCCYICLPVAIIIGLVALIASVVALALADFETAMNVSTHRHGNRLPHRPRWLHRRGMGQTPLKRGTGMGTRTRPRFFLNTNGNGNRHQRRR